MTDKLEEDENKNCPHEESKNDKRMSILADDDDNIPLIDVQSSAGMQQGMREGSLVPSCTGTQSFINTLC